MVLLTPIHLRQHGVETDVQDEALVQVVTGIEDEIIRRYGPHSGTHTITISGGGPAIRLPRRAESVTSITEHVGGVTTILAASDYRLGGRTFWRLSSGTYPRRTWGHLIDVTFVVRDDSARRRQVVVDLVKLTLAYSGVKSESVGQGDVAIGHLDYVAERERLFSSLREQMLVFA